MSLSSNYNSIYKISFEEKKAKNDNTNPIIYSEHKGKIPIFYRDFTFKDMEFSNYIGMLIFIVGISNIILFTLYNIYKSLTRKKQKPKIIKNIQQYPSTKTEQETLEDAPYRTLEEYKAGVSSTAGILSNETLEKYRVKVSLYKTKQKISKKYSTRIPLYKDIKKGIKKIYQYLTRKKRKQKNEQKILLCKKIKLARKNLLIRKIKYKKAKKKIYVARVIFAETPFRECLIKNIRQREQQNISDFKISIKRLKIKITTDEMFKLYLEHRKKRFSEYVEGEERRIFNKFMKKLKDKK